MTNEEYIDELLHEAEQLKVREYVLEMSRTLQDANPKMERCDSILLALNNAKLHSGLKTFNNERN